MLDPADDPLLNPDASGNTAESSGNSGDAAKDAQEAESVTADEADTETDASIAEPVVESAEDSTAAAGKGGTK